MRLEKSRCKWISKDNDCTMWWSTTKSVEKQKRNKNVEKIRERSQSAESKNFLSGKKFEIISSDTNLKMWGSQKGSLKVKNKVKTTAKTRERSQSLEG